MSLLDGTAREGFAIDVGDLMAFADGFAGEAIGGRAVGHSPVVGITRVVDKSQGRVCHSAYPLNDVLVIVVASLLDITDLMSVKVGSSHEMMEQLSTKHLFLIKLSRRISFK